MKNFFIIIIAFSQIIFADCETMYGQYFIWGGSFDIEEYTFGEENCCDEYPLPMCDDRVYFSKEDYADFTNPENWDIISDNIAITRADRQGLYNPILETGYNRGISPQETLWRFGPTFGGNTTTAIDPEVSYGPWTTWGYYNVNLPMLFGMYSVEDDAYYDFYVISWTSGNNPGTWPGTGGGEGSGNGGGFSYYRSGAIDFKPSIISIMDIPNDQGGRVYVHFNRTYIDVESHPFGINNYTIQRYDHPNWIGLGSIGADGQSTYFFEATTNRDSSNFDDGLTNFRVMAQNYVLDFTFYSDDLAGYSVDNIIPSIPTNLSAGYEGNHIRITWDHISDNDFQYYVLERDIENDFLSPQAIELINNQYLDEDVEIDQVYYYRIKSFDSNGNSSEFSNIVNTSGLSSYNIDTPYSFSLSQNYPNPFNPKTNIKFELEKSKDILVYIVNIKGLEIVTLLDGNFKSGSHVVEWNGTNSAGEIVPAGVYFYSLVYDNTRITKKMIFMK